VANVLAIDLGGTKVMAAVVTNEGAVVASARQQHGAYGNWPDAVGAVKKAADKAVAKANVPWEEIQSVGIGVPGPVDNLNGLAFQLPNLGLVDVQIASDVGEVLGATVIVENDVDAGLVGEVWRGAARGRRHAVGLFPGTGLGGAIYVNGELVRGKTGITGEIGHMVMNPKGPRCGCGRRGCLEAYASRTAMENWVRKRYLKGYGTSLEGIDDPDSRIRSRAFLRAAQEGDTLTLRAIDRVSRYLGYAAANLIHLLSPEIIVFGGGVIEAVGPLMMDRLREVTAERCLPGCFDGIELAEAQCGDQATVLGVAAVTFRAMGYDIS